MCVGSTEIQSLIIPAALAGANESVHRRLHPGLMSETTWRFPKRKSSQSRQCEPGRDRSGRVPLEMPHAADQRLLAQGAYHLILARPAGHAMLDPAELRSENRCVESARKIWSVPLPYLSALATELAGGLLRCIAAAVLSCKCYSRHSCTCCNAATPCNASSRWYREACLAALLMTNS